MRVEITDKTRFKGFNDNFKKAQAKAVRLAGQYLVKQVKSQSSYPPLPRKLGNHPYSRRGGSGSLSGRPWGGVAKVDGNFIKSIRGYLRHKRKGPTYTVDYGNKPAQHVVFVTSGTRVMIGRDVITHTYSQPHVQKQMAKIIEDTLREGVRNG